MRYLTVVAWVVLAQQALGQQIYDVVRILASLFKAFKTVLRHHRFLVADYLGSIETFLVCWTKLTDQFRIPRNSRQR